MNASSEWIDIIDSVPWSESDAAFWQWLDAHGLRREDLDAKDVQSEIMRGPHGTVVTWRLRRSLFERSLGKSDDSLNEPPRET